jgi:hypothetical protein
VAAGLEGRGLKFAEACFSEYSDWPAPSLLLLHEAACLVSELERTRGTKAERGALRLLLGVLQQLNLKG